MEVDVIDVVVGVVFWCVDIFGDLVDVVVLVVDVVFLGEVCFLYFCCW